MNIQTIRDAVLQNRWSLTEHAVSQMATRQIVIGEIRDVILNGEIIEEYPDDKYSPSCLILGQTVTERKLHIVCSSPPLVRIVTVYEPDPQEWIDSRRRKT